MVKTVKVCPEWVAGIGRRGRVGADLFWDPIPVPRPSWDFGSVGPGVTGLGLTSPSLGDLRPPPPAPAVRRTTSVGGYVWSADRRADPVGSHHGDGYTTGLTPGDWARIAGKRGPPRFLVPTPPRLSRRPPPGPLSTPRGGRRRLDMAPLPGRSRGWAGAGDPRLRSDPCVAVGVEASTVLPYRPNRVSLVGSERVSERVENCC